MATARNGRNNGRGDQPSRQSPSPARQGRAGGPSDPTQQLGQTPGEIFGQRLSWTTGASGTAGASGSADVTEQPGQLQDKLGGTSEHDITNTADGLGSTGAGIHGGGESVTYTDPFGYVGGVNREVTTQGSVSGTGDWTNFGNDNGFTGPTLPGLTNSRPVDTGVGKGRLRGAGKGL